MLRYLGSPHAHGLGGRLKVDFTHDKSVSNRVLAQIGRQIHHLSYKQWHTVITGDLGLRVELQPAGHILGSAYLEFDAKHNKDTPRAIFSSDHADILVIESTYGDRNPENRKNRCQRLKAACEHVVGNKGTLLIPVLRNGCTQEPVNEPEQISALTANALPLPASPGTTSTSSSTRRWQRIAPQATRN